MGLEYVEIILSMEDAFDITISDEEASKIVTPKDAIELISTKVQMGDGGACLNQIAFHQIRKILVDDFDLPRKEIRIDSDLGKLIPPERHSEFWEKIKDMIADKKIAHLSLPLWVSTLGWMLSVGTAVLVGIYTGWFAGLVAGLFAFFIFAKLAKPLRSQIPSYYAKIDLLVRYLVAISPDSFKSDKHWTIAQIKDEVKNIVIENLGVDEYDEDWEFVRDFGVG